MLLFRKLKYRLCFVNRTRTLQVSLHPLTKAHNGSLQSRAESNTAGRGLLMASGIASGNVYVRVVDKLVKIFTC